MTTLSVALATCDGERFLPDLLDSLAAQRRPPDELVVGDDRSTDATPGILTDFAERAPFPVRITRNGTRLGFSDNFLATATRCRSDVVAFCDQDDVWRPDKTSVILPVFGRRPDASVVTHHFRLIDAGGRTIGHGRPAWEHPPRLPGFALAFRRTLLGTADAGPRPADPGYAGPMPHDRWVSLVGWCVGVIVVLRDELVAYRQHDGNTLGPAAPPAGVLERIGRAADRRACTARTPYYERDRRYLTDLAEGWTRAGRPVWAARATELARRNAALARRDAGRAAVLSAPTRRQGAARWWRLYRLPAAWAPNSNWSWLSPGKELATALIARPADNGGPDP